MKKLLFIITAIISLFLFSNAQTTPPTIQWQKCLGGGGDDRANSIQQTNDGSYIVAGFTGSNDGDVTGNHGAYDYWIVKIDYSGNIQWQKSLGGSIYDKPNSIQQTNDGGYIVAGYSNSNDGDVTGNHGGGYDYWIVKLDSSGNLQWQKSLGGTYHDDVANSIQQTYEGGYIVAGYSCSSDGDITGNHGYGDYWVVKLDTTGNLQWQKSLGGSNDDGANSIQQTNDRGYIVAGFTGSNDGDVTGNHGGNFDYWIVKLDSSGNLQWQKSLGGTGDDWGSSIKQTTDEGYIVAGYSDSNDGDVTGNHSTTYHYYDYWVIKLDSAGNLQWQKCLGGVGAESAFLIQQTNDGGYAVAGNTWSNSGDVTGNHGFSDYWIVKLSFTTVIETQFITSEVSIYPNPTNGILNIKNAENSNIAIYNLLGELLISKKCNSAFSTINVSGLAEGTYIVKVVSEKNITTKKISVIK